MAYGDMTPQKWCAMLAIAALWTVQVSSLTLGSHQSSQRNFRLSGSVSASKQSCSKLINMNTHFTVEISAGTPPQKFELVADTGSDAVIVQSCVCRKFTPHCKESEDCFTGTNKSSTFVAPPKKAKVEVLHFGSGSIATAIATDVVRLGTEEATMTDGLYLMINRALQMAGHFEGILGLGVPSWVEKAKSPPKIAGADPANQKKLQEVMDQARARTPKNETDKFAPRLLEEAGVERFSMCMNDDGKAGVMRLQPPSPPKMLKQIGYHHWALDFRGFSVGSSSAPVKMCDKSKMKSHQDVACAAIPDSGTTLMLGPKEQVNALYADLCQRWPRCNDASSAPSDDERVATFKSLVYQCNSWRDTKKGLKEMPSIFMHLAGADGVTQDLELSPWSYVMESKTLSGEIFCEPLFGVWEQRTFLHGPVWIFGTPLFYEYQVVFGMPKNEPASIGFSEAACGSCGDGDKIGLVLDSGLRGVRRTPRIMSGKPRMPSIDPTQPL